jgi:tetratricopeptide (TPR) repeat protein
LASDPGTDEGIAAFNQGRYSVALTKLKDSHDPTGRLYFALSQAAQGDCKSALPELTKATGRLAGVAAVRCESAVGETSSALERLQKLMQQYPSDADVLYLSAKLHMKAFNDATLAMFQHAPSSYRVHELSAEIFEVENRYSDAVAEYRRAIEINPNAADLHFRLGRAILLGSHDPKALDEAAAEFREELKISPEDSACEFQLGQIALSKSDPAEAKPHFERAISLSPDFVQALIALAKLSTHEKAIELLTRAIKLQPANESARYALLTTYRNAGEMDKAKAEKTILDKLQKPPEGEFSDFLKKLGEKPPAQ